MQPQLIKSYLIHFLQSRIIQKQQLSMRNQHDYDENAMSETIPLIYIPSLGPNIFSPSITSRHGNSYFNDLDQLLFNQKQREEKRIQHLKEKQQHIGEQVGKRLADKQRKIREMEQEQKKKLYSECTFKPKTMSKGQKRSLNQFLQHQTDFTKKITEKRNNLKQNLQAQKNKNTFQPKTNNKSGNALTKKGKDNTVFERLYALKDKQNDVDNEQDQYVDIFQPKITQKSKKLNRNQPIDNLLYKDALRRQQKARDISSAANNSQNNKFQKPINLNNQKYVAQKFIKEYFSVIEKLNVPSSTHAQIEYMLFNEILKEMSFVQVQQDNESSHERALIHEAYQILQKYQVNAKNICVFLLAIVGVYHINPVNFQEGQQPIPQQQFALDEIEGRKLQKYFDLFKRNRLFSESHQRVSQKVQQSFSFHPKINQQSQQMAQKYRNQMLQEANKLLECYPELDYNIPEDGVITVTDLLILNNYAKQIKLQQRKDQNEKKQLQQCTFKPTTLSNSVSQTLNNSKFSSIDGSLGQKKSFELYNYHRNLQSKKESLQASRQSDDINLKECTFAPNLNRIKVPTDLSKFNTKQVEQNLFRMKKGREQAQQKKKFLQRGQRSLKKQKQYLNLKEKSQKLQEKSEDIPMLLLDVNLGQKTDRITLYQGDQSRLQEVAKQFAMRHSLDSENQQKLCQLLKIQLQNVLAKIDEDQQSDENAQ